MRIYSRFGYLIIGRLDYNRTTGISFGLFPRRNCPDWEICWHLSCCISGDWLPPRIYETIAAPAWVPGSSAAWTGREVRFAGFDWRRWYRPRCDFRYIPD